VCVCPPEIWSFSGCSWCPSTSIFDVLIWKLERRLLCLERLHLQHLHWWFFAPFSVWVRSPYQTDGRTRPVIWPIRTAGWWIYENRLIFHEVWTPEMVAHTWYNVCVCVRACLEWFYTAVHGSTGEPLGGRQVSTGKQRQSDARHWSQWLCNSTYIGCNRKEQTHLHRDRNFTCPQSRSPKSSNGWEQKRGWGGSSESRV